MRFLVQAILVCSVLTTGAMAQRGGGGGIAGGPRAPIGGGSRGGGGNGSHGGFGGFHGGFNNRAPSGFSYGFRNSLSPHYFSTPGIGVYGGLGLGYWPSSYYDGGYEPYQAYPAYAPSPAVTVIFPPPAMETRQPVPEERPRPRMREYDRNGNEVQSSAAPSSPIYLVAFKDQSIRAAASYWVSGTTLHYVTLQHDEKEVSLDSLDREMTLRLNRERNVPFQLQ